MQSIVHPKCACVTDWVVVVGASEEHCSSRVMRLRVETCSRYRYVDDEDDDEELTKLNIDGLSVRDFAVTTSPFADGPYQTLCDYYLTDHRATS